MIFFRKKILKNICNVGHPIYLQVYVLPVSFPLTDLKTVKIYTAKLRSVKRKRDMPTRFLYQSG